MKRHSTAATRQANPVRPPYPGTQAVLRAIAILKAFTDARPERSIAELSRELGLHKTTVFRLLAALEREGLIARAAGGGVYRLGPDAIALGAQALRSNDLRTAAHAELAALAASCGETTSLEVLVGDEVLVLDEILSRYLLGSTPAIGWRGPAHATSTGKVLLAAERYEGGGASTPRRANVRTRLVKVTPHTITAVARLERELFAIWKQGYATAIEEVEPGLVAVGAPVRDHEGRVVAALSIAGPRIRLPPARFPELAILVRQAAARVSLRLGCPPSRCS